MPAIKKLAPKDKSAKGKSATKPSKSGSAASDIRLDIVFVGPLLFVPATVDGNVTEVEVFAPVNGHPMAAVFVPGIYYSDAEIDSPSSERWPELESFSLLDPHSYAIDLTQAASKKNRTSPFPAAAIPDTNHKIKPGRKLSHEWNIAITVRGQLSAWSSHRLHAPGEGIYQGSDAPTSAQVAIAQRLTYNAVTGASFSGVSTEATAYLQANIGKGGTIIIQGEIPYQSSLLHEREAIASLARLAGLDLHLVSTTPPASRSRVTGHVIGCGFSAIIV
jgi:hypothetical protein